MFFYRITAVCEDKNATDDDIRNEDKILLQDVCNYLCTQSDNSRFTFIVNIRRGMAYIGALYKDKPMDIWGDIREFFVEAKLNISRFNAEEITLSEFMDMLRHAERNDLISDADMVCDTFELEFATMRARHSMDFGENLVDELPDSKVYALAKDLWAKDAFIAEFDRIYTFSDFKKFKGHPAHYFILTDDDIMRKKMCRALVTALYNAGRVESKRYCYFNIDTDTRMDYNALDAMYNVFAGGTIIVRYETEQAYDSDENNNAGTELYTLEKITKAMKKYRNDVQTIICMPKRSARLRQYYYEYLENLNIIELSEDSLGYEKAKNYFKSLARNARVRCNNKLYSSIDENKEYNVPELKQKFDVWYNEKLRTELYPQYSDVVIYKALKEEKRAKGAAYDALQSMIGLNDAKKVLEDALSFYKARALFEARGIKRSQPSMHMVFTGNPGTAKTTVARLFSEVMRDNKLLSRGHCIEVGRNDLVGKYVGWTAKIVERKFKEAEGGVLFIDEAYSLLDGHENSYGDEAINTIVQQMENHRKDVVVIFAGYPKEMEEFLQRNPGLRSRIAFHVKFQDYNADELCEITKYMAGKQSTRFTDEAIRKLHEIYEGFKGKTDFGNGRCARNILEHAYMKQANRLLACDTTEYDDEMLNTLAAEDIEGPEVEKIEKIRLGFS